MPRGGTAPRRTVAYSPAHWRERSSRRRLVREPAAGLSGGKQLGERGVDGGRLLGGDGVTRARDHQQPRSRRRALEKDAAVKAGFVLVADDDQERHRKSLQVRL